MDRNGVMDALIFVSRVAAGAVVEVGGDRRLVAQPDSCAAIDSLFTADDPVATCAEWFERGDPVPDVDESEVLAPIGTQEVWAAGVTYQRSRNARMSEAEQAGGDVFYDLVYDADRPEIFFKATAHRVVGPGQGVRIRSDSTWDVPEPELTLALSPSGSVIGYTIGNDMSSRSIEGENPLYLPQAKVYDGCAALGPRLVIGALPPPDTSIRLEIRRGGDVVFDGSTSLNRIKRRFDDLIDHLFRDNSFPSGAFLMTGTGIVPGDDFTLAAGDEVVISIDPVGCLRNHVVTAGRSRV